jgi:hypothetical protein
MGLIVRRQVAFARRNRKAGIDVDAALGAVAEDVRRAALEASAELTRLGIRHALCGGLAVGAHGYPRTTQRVEFLVGEEALERHGSVVTLRAPFQVHGVAVDSVPVPPEGPFLAEELDRPARPQRLAVVSIGALVFMKLLAGRRRDLSDVTELVKAGVDVEAVRRYLAEKSPQFIDRFAALVAEADAEEP